jgi:hypothetical protein
MTNFPTRPEKQIFRLGICPFGKSFSFVVVVFSILDMYSGVGKREFSTAVHTLATKYPFTG